MKERLILTLCMTLMMLANNVNGQVTLEAVDIRGTGIFGDDPDDPIAGVYNNHAANASAVTVNGVAPVGSRTTAEPIDIQMTYSNLDLEGDLTANDSVTFTVHYERVDFDGDGIDGGMMASFDQGIDTGFGNLNDLQVSVTGVTGTTTDSGSPIFFDGFSGAGALAASAQDVDRTIEINGTTITFAIPTPGGFHYHMLGTDFALTQTVSFDNSGDTDFDGNGDGGSGTIVARSFDMQFSLTDPDSSAVKGDVDLSGAVNFADIPPFIAVLQGGNFQAEADTDCSGQVNFGDIPAFIQILQNQ